MNNLRTPNPFLLGRERLMPQEEMLERGKKRRKLIIGVPKEDHEYESRIALIPRDVELLVNNGHQVIIESNAGEGISFKDTDYSERGALIVPTKEEVLKADIILKVSPLTLEEIDQLQGANQLVISALHIRCQPDDYIRKLIEKRVTTLAFEYLKDKNKTFPVVRSMSEIAGSTSVLIAAEYLSNVHNGKGKMLGGVSGVNPSEVVILGAGTAGEYAARTAMGLGAVVKVFDNSISKLRRLQNNLGQRIFTSVIQPGVLRNALKTADVAIGAVRLIDKGPRFLVTEDMVRNMKKDSVIIDISIDQGGCFETSRLTDHINPTFREHGVIHYCVPNIASRVARTASYALSNIFSPIIIDIGESGGINSLLKDEPGIRHGVYIYKGILTNHYIGELVGISSKDIDLLMAAF